MRTLFATVAAAAALAVAPGRGDALELIDLVTKQRAEVLGLQFRHTPSGPEYVRVELEFPTAGELERYQRVVLEVSEKGKHVASATLKEDESKPGRVVVSFVAARAKLDQFTLKVVTLDRAATRIGHVIRVADFADVGKVR